MATPYIACPDPNSVWSACVFTQMLNSFDQAIREGLTGGVIGVGLEILTITASFAVICFCIALAMWDDDQVLAHILGLGIKAAIYAELIAKLFPLAMEFADGAIAIGLLIGTPAAALWGVAPLTLEQFQDPGSILLVGWRLYTPLFDYIENIGLLDIMWHTVTITVYAFVAAFGWLCILWIGINIIVGWVELMLLAAVGTPLLAFAIFEHTRFIGGNVIRALVQGMIRMGLFATLLSLIFPVLRSLQTTDPTDPGWDTVLALLGSNLLFAYLSWQSDALAARLVGGSSGHVGQGLKVLVQEGAKAAGPAGQAASSVLRRAA